MNVIWNDASGESAPFFGQVLNKRIYTYTISQNEFDKTNFLI